MSSGFTSAPREHRLGPPLIGALLRRPWEVVRDRILAGLHARGFEDVTPAHLNVLQYPGPDAARPSELACRIRMSRQALNYLLGQLETLGYLERRDASGDQRLRQIYLTARGHEAMATIREMVAQVEADWEQQLGAQNFSKLRELLTALNAITVDAAREPSSSD